MEGRLFLRRGLAGRRRQRHRRSGSPVRNHHEEGQRDRVRFQRNRSTDAGPCQYGDLRREGVGDVCARVAHRPELPVQRRHVACGQVDLQRSLGRLARIPVACRELHAVDAPADGSAGGGAGQVPAGEGRGSQRRQRRYAGAQLADRSRGSAPLHPLRDPRLRDRGLESGGR